MIFIVLLTFSAIILHSNAVFQFPQRPKFLVRELGRQATFDCRTGDPEIRPSLWFKAPFENGRFKWIRVFPQPGKVKENNGVFTLIRLTVRNAGFYECRAESREGENIDWKPNQSLLFLIRPFNLHVKVFPREVEYRKKGETVKFICESNIPSAHLKWYKTVENGFNNPIAEQPVTPNKGYQIREKKTNSAHYLELIIGKLEEAEEGLYICKGSFKGQRDYQYSRVTMLQE